MIELRPNNPPRKTKEGDAIMDEVVATRASVHFEMMSDTTLWGRIDSGKQSVVIWVNAVRGRLVFTAEFE